MKFPSVVTINLKQRFFQGFSTRSGIEAVSSPCIKHDDRRFFYSKRQSVLRQY